MSHCFHSDRSRRIEFAESRPGPGSLRPCSHVSDDSIIFHFLSGKNGVACNAPAKRGRGSSGLVSQEFGLQQCEVWPFPDSLFMHADVYAIANCDIGLFVTVELVEVC